MRIQTAAARFALIATGILMVVLAAVASVMTTPSAADATSTNAIVSVAFETGLVSGASASGRIGSVG